MDFNPTVGPSFFKLLFDDDIISKLLIPPEFVVKYGEIFRPRIKLRLDDEPGKVWRLGIEQIGHHSFFTQGWSKFAKDVELNHEDFLIFKLIDGSEFQVSVYDTAGCKKEFSFSDGMPGTSPGSGAGPSCRKFTKKMMKHHFATARLDIPVNFARVTGIVTNRQVKLADTKGRKWPANVTDRNLGRYSITSGWMDFLSCNNVRVGDVLSFEFIGGSDNVIQARVIKH